MFLSDMAQFVFSLFSYLADRMLDDVAQFERCIIVVPLKKKTRFFIEAVSKNCLVNKDILSIVVFMHLSIIDCIEKDK